MSSEKAEQLARELSELRQGLSWKGNAARLVDRTYPPRKLVPPRNYDEAMAMLADCLGDVSNVLKMVAELAVDAGAEPVPDTMPLAADDWFASADNPAGSLGI